MISETEMQNLKVAFEAGLARAAQMVPGTKFIGSMPEAVAAGFAKGTLEYAAFQIAFLDALPQPVIVDADGLILPATDR